jgi:hypothetical protein
VTPPQLHSLVMPRPHLPRPIDHANEWIVTFEGVGTLRASIDGLQSSWSTEDSADPAIVRKVQNGCVRAFLARLGGQVAFHAGAVAVAGRALLILGDSGAGKSTTTASMCAVGAELLADDYALLRREGDKVLVEPSEDAHWLDEHAHALVGGQGKHRVVSAGKGPVSRAMGGLAELTCFVELRFIEDGPVRLTPQHGLAAFQMLLNHILRFVSDDASVQVWETERLVELATMPCYMLERPRGQTSLAASTSKLLSLLEAR